MSSTTPKPLTPITTTATVSPSSIPVGGASTSTSAGAGAGGKPKSSDPKLIKVTEDFLKLCASTDGRDKFAKVLHYGAKFLGWALVTNKVLVSDLATVFAGPMGPERTQLVKRIASFEAGVADGRKVFRFGKFLTGYLNIIKLFTDEKQRKQKITLIKALQLLSGLSMANYFLFDHLGWASKHGVIRPRKFRNTTLDTAQYSKWSSTAWFWGLVLTIIADALQYSKLNQRESELRAQIRKKEARLEYLASSSSSSSNAAATASANNNNNNNNATTSSAITLEEYEVITLKQELSDLQNQKRTLHLNFIKNAADMGLSAALVKLWEPGQGWMGIFGLISAIVGGYQMWPSS